MCYHNGILTLFFTFLQGVEKRCKYIKKFLYVVFFLKVSERSLEKFYKISRREYAYTPHKYKALEKINSQKIAFLKSY